MGRSIILPDTNILIYSGSNLPPYNRLFTQWLENQQLALSTITIAEYLIKSTPAETEALNLLIDRVPILNVDLPTARLAAQIRRTQLKRKIKLHLPDCFLAAQAKLNNAQLATLNAQDFPASIPLFPFP